MNDRVFGCDICQEVCPWNRRPRPARMPVGEKNETAFLRREDWQNMTHEQFLTAFRKTPLHRTGYSRLMRNVQACSSSVDDDH